MARLAERLIGWLLSLAGVHVTVRMWGEAPWPAAGAPVEGPVMDADYGKVRP